MTIIQPNTIVYWCPDRSSAILNKTPVVLGHGSLISGICSNRLASTAMLTDGFILVDIRLLPFAGSSVGKR